MFKNWKISSWLFVFMTYGLWAVWLASRNKGISVFQALSGSLTIISIIGLTMFFDPRALMTKPTHDLAKGKGTDSKITIPAETTKIKQSKLVPEQIQQVKTEMKKTALPTQAVTKPAAPEPIKTAVKDVETSKPAKKVVPIQTVKKDAVSKPVKAIDKKTVTTVPVIEVKEDKMDEAKYQRFKIFAESQKNDIEKLKKLQKTYPKMFARLLKEKQ